MMICRKLLWFFWFFLSSCKHTSYASIQVLLENDYSYHVVDSANRTLFQGGEIAVFMGGTWCLADHHHHGEAVVELPTSSSSTPAPPPNTLLPNGTVSIHGWQDGLGYYKGVQIQWTCTLGEESSISQADIVVVPVLTSFKNFDSGLAILFEVEWPDGAPKTNMSDPDEALANFPVFLLNNNTHALPSALSWHGSFVQSVHGHGHSVGPRGGPTVFYNSSDTNLSTVIVGSPFGGNWKTFTAGNNLDYKGRPALSPGTSGRISSLPKGFQQSFLLYQGKRGGITSALAEWGEAMKRSRASKGHKIKDVTLRKVGYQTDNGAMYCFCKDKNCSDTLIKEVESLAAMDTPMGYLSFQGAGASTGRGTAAPWCVETWGVDGGLDRQHYPLDLVPFQEALGIPLQLYAPYFCPSTTYFGNQTNRNWSSVSSDPALPECEGFSFTNVAALESRDFYGWFLDKGLKAGMSSFEPDFMNQNFNCVPDFIHSATEADRWLHGMAEAALARNVSIQLCYATPTDVLASIDLPAVTNFRVSFDFCYGRSWDIGESSLLVWALGAAPSKDTLWTTDNERTAIPGCPWTLDHETPAAELHLVLSLMSTGPVGISDAIGMTNTTLLKRAVRKDGVLLKPMKAITAVDSSFVEPASGGRLEKEGYLYGTSGLGPSWIFVSFKLKESFAVTLKDFWPSVTDNAPLLMAYRQFADGIGCTNGTDAVSSGCVRLVSVEKPDPSQGIFVAPAASSDSQPGSDFSPSITSVWQSCTERGWFFLGELNKYVSLSPARFSAFTCTPSGVTATITGSVGEVVELTVLRPHHSKTRVIRYEVILEEVTIPERKVIRVMFGESHGTSSDPPQFSTFVHFS